MLSTEQIIALFTRPILLGDRIQYFLDENMDQRLVRELRDQDITVIRVEDQDIKGERNDTLILARATELGCVLVTCDRDIFAVSARLDELRPSADTHHAGIIFQTRPYGPGELIRKLAEYYREKEPTTMQDLIWYM